MTVTCAAGHTSTATDYCDVCGSPLTEAAAPGAPVSSAAGVDAPAAASPTEQPEAGESADKELTCPHCAAPHEPDALFCEACGYDFTTQTMPRTVPAAEDVANTPGGPDQAPADSAAAGRGPAAWVAEVWIDPDWYAVQDSEDPLPSAGPPQVVALRGSSLLIGRTSRSRGTHPDLACETDTGVSRRQAQLTTDGDRWWVEDLDSSNGTFVGRSGEALPEQPIPVGSKHELATGDRIYLGAWTRIVVREAAEDERDL